MNNAPKVVAIGSYQITTRKIRRPRVAGGMYRYEVPELTIAGRALEEAGFPPGSRVIVTCPRPGALVVQRVIPGAAIVAAPSPRRASS